VEVNATYLRSLPKDQVEKALSSLTAKQLIDLKHSWHFWARPEQLEPSGDEWNTWFINAGRGFGKSRAGVEWVREQIKNGKRRIAAVAATNSDIERVMVKGESGFLNCCSPSDKTHKGKLLGFPVWSPTKRQLTWENGAYVQFFSAEEPERLRGPQFEAAWCDELAAWNKDIDTWDMLQFCMRLGKHPRICVTTTPRSTTLVRKILKDPRTVVTTGSTFDNAANLATTYLQAVKDQYEGTRLGRQELYAEVLSENEGALWTGEMIDACQIKREDLPEMSQIIVSVDPATSNNVESDSTGIIIAGLSYEEDINGVVYILEDHTFKGLPETWASKAVSLYHDWDANFIVYERNQGGDLIPTLFKSIDENIPLRGVFASNAKIARAEPVSLLYEKGRVKHVSNPASGDPSGLKELETQMTTYEPMGKHKSPDRYDSMVWAVTMLLLKGRSNAPLKLLNLK
jgi:phage terminase large subunit-like protein